MTALDTIHSHPKVQKARDRVADALSALSKAQADEAEKAQEPGPITRQEQLVLEAQQAESEALQEARKEALDHLRKEHVAAVEDLSNKLRQAAEANARVRALEEQAQQLRIGNGSTPGLPILSWADLCEESSTRATKLSLWLREANDYLETHSVISNVKRKGNRTFRRTR